jgi:DNA-binding transcriptional ArsR family regulator
MARASTTSDVFNAIAEPRRRQIIDLLLRDERAVTDLVRSLRLPQPAVSKHLRVLRRVRVVSVSRRGRQRLYRLNPTELKPVHDWIKHFERYWTHQISRIKARAEERAQQQRKEQS